MNVHESFKAIEMSMGGSNVKKIRKLNTDETTHRKFRYYVEAGVILRALLIVFFPKSMRQTSSSIRHRVPIIGAHYLGIDRLHSTSYIIAQRATSTSSKRKPLYAFNEFIVTRRSSLVCFRAGFQNIPVCILTKRQFC